MVLPAPDLDDRRFQDLVDEAKRLIPQKCPDWTNHNVADPGVALIELFAWMTEMVVYRLNQVPERAYVDFLNLVGITPFPPSVARADLTFTLSTVLDRAVVVPAGTEVATTGEQGSEAVVFTTTRQLDVRPPQLVAAATSRADVDERVTDVWDDLRYESGVECFGSLQPGDALCLGFADSLASTLVGLQVRATVEGIGVDPRRPPLSWQVWTDEGWFTTPVESDGTGGLNRDGTVVLAVPAVHDALTLGGRRAYWLRACLDATTGTQPPYRASPQVRSVRAVALGGTVAAEHSTVLPGEVLGRSSGAPGQEFRLSRAPVLPCGEGDRVQVVTQDGGVSDWTEVDDFGGSGPTDRHVVWERTTGTVRFGPRIRYPDGAAVQHGAVPPDGALVRVTGFRHGGGAIGNVGAHRLTVLRSTVPYVDRVTNRRAAGGGVDAETAEEAKMRGPLTLRTGSRAVTPGDFERLTREASLEVARAQCLPARRPGGPVRVLVVPHVRSSPVEHVLDDYALSQELLELLQEHLDERRLVGTRVAVGTPYYQGVSVAALVRAQKGRPSGTVRDRVAEAVSRYVNPLTGGRDGAGWPFGAALNSGALAQLVEGVDGVERVEEVLLFEYDLRTGERTGPTREVLPLQAESLFLAAPPRVVVR